MRQLILFMIVFLCCASTAEAGIAKLWHRICEKIIADDPYQYEELSVDQLIQEYFWLTNMRESTEPVVHEMGKRLRRATITDEDRIVINSCLANERKQ